MVNVVEEIHIRFPDVSKLIDLFCIPVPLQRVSRQSPCGRLSGPQEQPKSLTLDDSVTQTR